MDDVDVLGALDALGARQALPEAAALVAEAIHQGHAFTTAGSQPCFLCRREARSAMSALDAAGFRVIRVTSPAGRVLGR